MAAAAAGRARAGADPGPGSATAARIVADGIGVDLPVAPHRALSLRNAALARMHRIGGRVLDRGTQVKLVRALDGVTFTLRHGDRLGLIGPNGSGKTTLIRVLAGIYAPTAGRLRIEGTRVPLTDIATGSDDEATGYENIRLRGLLLGLGLEEIESRTAEIAAFSGLGDYLHLPVRTYSTGMLLRLMFAIATSIEGNIVLMDEWIAVGDQDFRRKANERLRAIAARAGILVIASHDEGILRELCTLGLRLEAGTVQHFGPIGDVLAAGR
jgi:ABC-2 type transport system ATP-binding protein/lipopolysaccharide transport system ATP-binding protein